MASGVSRFLADLGSPEPLRRFGALASLREALERGEDISPAEDAIRLALSDKDQDVREKAARLLVYLYGGRKEWGKVDALLAHQNGEVRASALFALAAFVGSFSLASDVPNLGKALDDNSFDVRAEAVNIFAKAAEKGLDIAFAVPGLRRAAIYGDEKVKERVEIAITASQMRK